MPKVSTDLTKIEYDVILANGKKNGRILAAEVRFALQHWIKSLAKKGGKT